ncbi:proteoglycan 4-like [Homarus americanus]|uniref:proteoglycan 4-like n=1 Tax=Homarus americanus TaxID=6706 RepID=UPI001C455663|nr:proteoglycan 4-like [Homarus americanus]
MGVTAPARVESEGPSPPSVESTSCSTSHQDVGRSSDDGVGRPHSPSHIPPRPPHIPTAPQINDRIGTHAGQDPGDVSTLPQHTHRHTTLTALSERLAMGKPVKRKLWQVNHEQVKEELEEELVRVEEEEQRRFRTRWKEISPEYTLNGPTFYYSKVVTARGETVIPGRPVCSAPSASPPGDMKLIHREAKRRRIQSPPFPPVEESTVSQDVTGRILRSTPEDSQRHRPSQPKISPPPPPAEEVTETHVSTPVTFSGHVSEVTSERTTCSVASSSCASSRSNNKDASGPSESPCNDEGALKTIKSSSNVVASYSSKADGQKCRETPPHSTTTTPDDSRITGEATTPPAPPSGTPSPDVTTPKQTLDLSTSSKSSSGVSSAESTPSEDVTPTPSEDVTPTPSEDVTPTPSEDVTPTPLQETRVTRRSSRQDRMRRQQRPGDTPRRYLRM